YHKPERSTSDTGFHRQAPIVPRAVHTMSALHFRLERPAFARFGATPLRRNVVLRVLMGLLGVAVLAVLVFVSVFVGAAMIAAGLLARLWRQRGKPRAQAGRVVDAEYRVVGKAS